jgi:molecular chaperone GrpE
LKEDIAGEEKDTVEDHLSEPSVEETDNSDQIQENGEKAADEIESGIEVEPTIEEQLAQAEAKAAEYLDGWQRARAEFANARKRLERGRIEAYSTASVDYVTKLLPIIDDLGRAMTSAPPEVVSNPWFEGLDLVNRKIQSMLEAMDVKPIEAVGQPFDPNFHEALSLQASEDVESGIVIEELQTGYRLGDKVIRPSLVNVSA